MAWVRVVCVLYMGTKHHLFEKLLEQDKSVTRHTRNLQMLATEMFKVYRNIIKRTYEAISFSFFIFI